MTTKQLDRHRVALHRMLERLRGDTLALEDATRADTGGESGGELSNVPMHLGDLGTESYMQELNSSLLESESQLREEVLAALERLDQSGYGRCEECGRKIPEARLDVVPYTRYCAKCAAEVETPSPEVRQPRGDEEEVGAFTRDKIDDKEEPERESEFDEVSFTDFVADREREMEDTHAAGTPGGGSALGGLAGTTVGSGDPDDVDLEDAMGSGSYDAELSEEGEELDPFSGSAGGPGGGTPESERSVGGKSKESR